MTSLLSSISGFFSKTLILGTFLPVIVFITFGILFVVPLVPADLAILKPVAALDAQWQVLIITFVAILLSGLLYNLNIPLIRMYEGYPWRETWVGRLRSRHYRSRYDAFKSRQRGMRTLLRAMGKAKEDAALVAAVIDRFKTISPAPKCLTFEERGCSAIWETNANAALNQWNHLYDLLDTEWNATSRELLKGFPDAESLVLPTKLGNVIRSFEHYPDREYDMDAVTLWPRLVAKIDKDYAALVDDSKTSFDFMLNGSALSATLALIILLIGLLYGAPLAMAGALIQWLVEIMIFTVLSFILYHQSISRAANWGEMVKGAFDLYRNDLLKLLGFEQKPKTKKAERALWKNISLQLIYGDTPAGPRAAYADEQTPAPATFARGVPPDVSLEVSRGIDYMWADGSVIVALLVENVDEQRRTARKVLVTETLPPDLEYAWGSARLNGAPLREVSGTNPHVFKIGDLGPHGWVLLTYAAYRRKT
ncbi:MAG TPA: hypothetical protein VJT09_06870 [Pyrinomonadaceae bacterium]|nr:hypothetical protein [Pyrinomonadaceae bacterium]